MQPQPVFSSDPAPAEGAPFALGKLALAARAEWLNRRWADASTERILAEAIDKGGGVEPLFYLLGARLEIGSCNHIGRTPAASPILNISWTALGGEGEATLESQDSTYLPAAEEAICDRV